MHYRRFGRTRWNVSEIGYGMWGMAGWTGSEDTESLASLQRSVDLGCNFFDTAWAYGDGHSEELLGKILRANKNAANAGPDKKLYVATKIPPKNRRWPSRREFLLDDCFPPDHIVEYVEKSLSNIGVDTLDLIQFHTWEDKWLDETSACRAPSKICAAAAKSAPSASASIAGNRGTAFAPCAPATSTLCKSSTTFSTKIPRTNYFPHTAAEYMRSHRALPVR